MVWGDASGSVDTLSTAATRENTLKFNAQSRGSLKALRAHLAPLGVHGEALQRVLHGLVVLELHRALGPPAHVPRRRHRVAGAGHDRTSDALCNCALVCLEAASVATAGGLRGVHALLSSAHRRHVAAQHWTTCCPALDRGAFPSLRSQRSPRPPRARTRALRDPSRRSRARSTSRGRGRFRT